MTAKSKTMIVIGVIIVLMAGTAAMLLGKRSSQSQSAPWSKPAPTTEQIAQANVGLPDPQIEAKTLIFGAMSQRKIPAADNWCETLNAGGRIWPVTPTNTVFALNKEMAGRAYSRTMRGDTVVFFEASKPGWNQTGGSELLAQKSGGVAVALLDGRALIVPPDEAAKLNWTP